MCGFIGIVSTKPLLRKSIIDKQFQKAYLYLKARGPDDKGIWTDDYSYLLHTRLKILDLGPLSAQPMKKDNYIICFNGEIYNFPEIKETLLKKGHILKSRGDTEIVLSAWREWGEGMLERLDGMFSFAIWDNKNKNLFLARDRFGKKPLVYCIKNNSIYFASDVKSLSCIVDGGDINKKAIHSLFRFRFIHEPMTIYKDFLKLPPGSLLKFNEYGSKKKIWYNLKTSSKISRDTNLNSLKYTVTKSVNKRLISDVPIGLFLSGGLDSGIIIQSLAEIGRKVPTFTVGFRNASSYYNETDNAKKISTYYGFENKTILLNPKNVLRSINEVLEANDEPFADSSAIAMFMISKAVKNDIKVALTGDGGDEIFGGYRKYSSYKWGLAMRILPNALKKILISVLPDSKNNKYTNKTRILKRFLESFNNKFEKMQINLLDQLSDFEFYQVFGVKKKNISEKLFRNAYTFGKDLNNILARDFYFSLLGDMLVKLDRHSMANSIEVRSPFLDKDLVEQSFGISANEKIGFLNGKKILRKCYKGDIPRWYFKLPKRGFEIPLQSWLKNDLKYLVDQATESKVMESLNIRNKKIIENWKNEFLTGKQDHSWKLWSLIVYSHWARKTKII